MAAATTAWLRLCGMQESGFAEIRTALASAGVDLAASDARAAGPGIVCFSTISDELVALLRDIHRSGVAALALAAAPGPLSAGDAWRLLRAGAADALAWATDGSLATQIRARIDRWNVIDRITLQAVARVPLVGAAMSWGDLLRRIVEAARFGDAPVLLMGESGTGKELLARLIHLVHAQSTDDSVPRPDLVTVDCSTIVPELSGSEFFGHEKGAFTGAIVAREGAFAEADGGTLFLDEVGELAPGLQVQLLRVVQEKTYKRVGGNVWRSTNFRLVSATNRDLGALVAAGQFRLDLFHRLAGTVFRVPSLRERREDILPLAEHFLGECCRGDEAHAFDAPVRDYLVSREYPGNIRELRQLVHRVAHRHVGPGPITAGDIPPEDRPEDNGMAAHWPDDAFEAGIRHALTIGLGLREINRVVTETAIGIAVQSERGNLPRAARRLGVTDRALQLRRARKAAS